MASVQPSPLRSVAAVIALLLAAALALHFLSAAYAKYAHLDAAAYGMFWTRRHWLWVHLAGGVLAMVLGSVQFIGPLRRAWPRAHRWIGRTYLLGIATGLAGAVALIATSPAPIAIRIAFAGIATAWAITAALGYAAIRGKDIVRHRRWMIRNYLVTLAPALFRLMLIVPGVMALASPRIMIPLLLWLSWVAPLAMYELGRRLRISRGNSPRPA